MRERANASVWQSRARLLALLAGGIDTATGTMLVAAPDFTLRMMGVGMPDAAAPFVRFIGAFVLGVGLAYFSPLLREGGERSDVALRAVFVATGIIRLSIGLFTGLAVISGGLIWPWLSVTVSDLTLAAVQGLIVRGKVLDGEN